MATKGSILAPPRGKPTEPLIETVDKVPFFKKSAYNTKEKAEWWRRHPRFQVGLLKTKDLPSKVQIFDEPFNFGIRTVDKEKSANVQKAEIEPSAKQIKNVKELGFNISNAPRETFVAQQPGMFKTAREFELLYLGWLDEASATFSEDDKKTIKAAMKSLFRFLFSDLPLNRLTPFHTRLRIAYTSLSPSDRIPCNTPNATLYEHFKKCLEWRLQLSNKQLGSQIAVVGSDNQYVEQTLGRIGDLRQILDQLTRQGNPCFIYSSREYPSGTVFDDDYLRLLRVFRNFVRDRKDKLAAGVDDTPSLEELRAKILEARPEDEDKSMTAEQLYDDLMRLLQWAYKDGRPYEDVLEEMEGAVEALEDQNLLLEGQLDFAEDKLAIQKLLFERQIKIMELERDLAILKCRQECCCQKKDGILRTLAMTERAATAYLRAAVAEAQGSIAEAINKLPAGTKEAVTQLTAEFDKRIAAVEAGHAETIAELERQIAEAKAAASEAEMKAAGAIAGAEAGAREAEEKLDRLQAAADAAQVELAELKGAGLTKDSLANLLTTLADKGILAPGELAALQAQLADLGARPTTAELETVRRDAAAALAAAQGEAAAAQTALAGATARVTALDGELATAKAEGGAAAARIPDLERDLAAARTEVETAVAALRAAIPGAPAGAANERALGELLPGLPALRAAADRADAADRAAGDARAAQEAARLAHEAAVADLRTQLVAAAAAVPEGGLNRAGREELDRRIGELGAAVAAAQAARATAEAAVEPARTAGEAAGRAAGRAEAEGEARAAQAAIQAKLTALEEAVRGGPAAAEGENLVERVTALRATVDRLATAESDLATAQRQAAAAAAAAETARTEQLRELRTRLIDLIRTYRGEEIPAGNANANVKGAIQTLRNQFQAASAAEAAASISEAERRHAADMAAAQAAATQALTAEGTRAAAAEAARAAAAAALAQLQATKNANNSRYRDETAALRAQLAEAEARAAEAQRRADEAGRRAAGAEGAAAAASAADLQAAQQAAGAAQAEAARLRDQLAAAERRAGAAEGRANAAERARNQAAATAATARAEVTRIQGELATAQEQARAADERAGGANERARAAAQARVDGLQAELATAQGRVREAEASIERRVGEGLADLQAELAAARASLTQKERELAAETARAGAAEGRANAAEGAASARVRGEVEALRARIGVLEGEVAAAEDRAGAAEGGLAERQRELDAARATLAQQTEALRAAEAGARNAGAERNRAREEVARELAQLRDGKATAEARVRELTDEVAAARAEAGTARAATQTARDEAAAAAAAASAAAAAQLAAARAEYQAALEALRNEAAAVGERAEAAAGAVGEERARTEAATARAAAAEAALAAAQAAHAAALQQQTTDILAALADTIRELGGIPGEDEDEIGPHLHQIEDIVGQLKRTIEASQAAAAEATGAAAAAGERERAAGAEAAAQATARGEAEERAAAAEGAAAQIGAQLLAAQTKLEQITSAFEGRAQTSDDPEEAVAILTLLGGINQLKAEIARLRAVRGLPILRAVTDQPAADDRMLFILRFVKPGTSADMVDSTFQGKVQVSGGSTETGTAAIIRAYTVGVGGQGAEHAAARQQSELLSPNHDLRQILNTLTPSSTPGFVSTQLSVIFDLLPLSELQEMLAKYEETASYPGRKNNYLSAGLHLKRTVTYDSAYKAAGIGAAKKAEVSRINWYDTKAAGKNAPPKKLGLDKLQGTPYEDVLNLLKAFIQFKQERGEAVSAPARAGGGASGGGEDGGAAAAPAALPGVPEGGEGEGEEAGGAAAVQATSGRRPAPASGSLGPGRPALGTAGLPGFRIIAAKLPLTQTGPDQFAAGEKAKELRKKIAESKPGKLVQGQPPTVEDYTAFIEQLRSIPEKDWVHNVIRYVAGGDVEILRKFIAAGILPATGGGGKPKANSKVSSLCESMLILLMLAARSTNPNKPFNAQAFLDKAGKTLDDLGQCPLVLHTLNELLEEAEPAKNDSLLFKPFKNENQELHDQFSALTRSYNTHFTPEEQEMLESMSPPGAVNFYTPPDDEELTGALGAAPFKISGRPRFSEEEDTVDLEGVLEEMHVSLSRAEWTNLNQSTSSIPLGALLFLYLVCLRDVKQSGETISLESKCQLPVQQEERSSSPRPRRRRSRSPKTAKQKK